MQAFHLHKKNTLKTDGFTLVELAIVLAIIGVVLASGLSVFGNRIAAEKSAETARRLNLIEDALLLHRRTFGNLPTPADGIVLTGSNLGAATATTSAGMLRVGGSATTYNYIGVVPTRTLNLSDSLMLDAYGNKITYIVDAACTSAGSGWATTDCGDAAAIQVQDSTLSAVNTRTNTAVYALVSHGPNMRGAWQQKIAGQITATPPGTTYGSTLEAENTDNDAVVVDMMRQETNTATTHYDDFVRWKVKNQL